MSILLFRCDPNAGLPDAWFNRVDRTAEAVTLDRPETGRLALICADKIAIALFGAWVDCPHSPDDRRKAAEARLGGLGGYRWVAVSEKNARAESGPAR